jgi:hypothetical protein
MARTTKDPSMTQDLANRGGGLTAPQLDYILVDGSGSMMNKWWDCLAALDGFMDVLKSQGVASHGIVSVFDDHNISEIQRDGEIAHWKTFSEEPLGAHWGGTPLYDAINFMGRHLKELAPPRASIVIITDGAESDSKHTSAAQARAILDWCRAKGWQVTFLGADFNNSNQAKLLGANDSNSIGVRSMKMLEAGKALGEKRARNALFGEDINFTADEKENFGGYLAAPEAK